MTANQVLKEMVARFTQAGIENPQLDARLLLQHVLGWSHTDYIMGKQNMLSDDTIRSINALAERRMAGEPVDHIFGYREFYGRRFKISQDVLSPRPETEGLVDEALEYLQGTQSAAVLDLGTGSGAIIISILAELTSVHGVAVDVSGAALKIANDNAKALGVGERLDLLQGRWFEFVSGTYDLILSNPPYITNAAMDELSTEVREFDPDLALRGGADGLEAYKVILSKAKDYLNPGGILLFEIGYDQGKSVSDLVNEAGFTNVRVIKDLAGHDRIVSGHRRDN